jgi:hypothetical protein
MARPESTTLLTEGGRLAEVAFREDKFDALQPCASLKIVYPQGFRFKSQGFDKGDVAEASSEKSINSDRQIR